MPLDEDKYVDYDSLENPSDEEEYGDDLSEFEEDWDEDEEDDEEEYMPPMDIAEWADIHGEDRRSCFVDDPPFEEMGYLYDE